ncbi:MAG: MucB/RseB C-terminal domain-containing protein [Candidatus Symbiodolus clandestinus]
MFQNQQLTINRQRTGNYWRRDKLVLSFIGLLFFCPSLITANEKVVTKTTAEQLLQQMVSASRSSHYELFFLLPHDDEPVTLLRYRHAMINQQSIEQLTALEGPSCEISWCGKQLISCQGQYLPETVNTTLTLMRSRLPRVMRANPSRLYRYYEVIQLSNERVADRQCYVIRLNPRDPHRYGYQLWIDCRTKLLMRSASLINHDKPSEQFHVVALSQGKRIAQTLSTVVAGRCLTVPKQKIAPTAAVFDWKPGWLPPGFEQVLVDQDCSSISQASVTMQLYSDGVLSIAVYVHAVMSTLPSDPLLLQKKQCTVYSETRLGREITVIGEIPISSARHIVQKVVFNES